MNENVVGEIYFEKLRLFKVADLTLTVAPVVIFSTSGVTFQLHSQPQQLL